VAARWQAVLFDLDGTLIDSAADLAAAANAMRLDRGLAALPLSRYRAHAGSGARGMLAQAFDAKPGEPDFDRLKLEFLDRYEVLMFATTQLFGGVAVQLDGLQRLGIPWGIVTNKAERFALPIASALGLRAGAIVGGDTTAHTKPHPEPLLECARRMGVDAAYCLYVGDDERDVRAGRAAGMATAIATWGYLGPDADIRQWCADFVLDSPTALLNCAGLA